VVRETRLAPEMSITLCKGYSDGGENAGGARHAIATRLLTAVCGFTRASFFTRTTHKPLRHRARYIHDHVTVLFDIIVEQINYFKGVDLPFENCLHMHSLINGYLILSKMFLKFD
jgi:hypothetical protein